MRPAIHAPRAFAVRLALAVAAALLLAGRTSAAPDPRGELGKAVAERRWEEAIALAQEILATGAEDALVRLHLGVALQELGRGEEARAAYQSAIALDPPGGGPRRAAQLQLARLAALEGDADAAFAWLRQGVGSGFRGLDRLDTDPAFASLRADPRFAEVRAALLASVTPCAVDPLFSALDFWIGDWEQQDRTGRVVGTTSIVEDTHGCVLLESTENPPLYRARAMHTFDRRLGRWRQHYVDSSATLLVFEGVADAAGIVYLGTTERDGRSVQSRNTIRRVDPDRLAWRWEESTDGGQTWTVRFDGFYVRRAPGVP